MTDQEHELLKNAPAPTRNEICLGMLSLQILTHLKNREAGYTITEIATSVSKSLDVSHSVCASRVRSLRDARFVAENGLGNLIINEQGLKLREVLKKRILELVNAR